MIHGLLPGKKATFQRSLDRARLLPGVPDDDLKGFDIPERYKVTSSQARFLILNTAGEESGDLILGFASPVQLEVMRSCPSWYCDGTDSPVSRLEMFCQLFIILAHTSAGISLPVGFFLTSNRSETTYRRIFRFLRDECGVAGPEKMLSNLEKVVHNNCTDFTIIIFYSRP